MINASTTFNNASSRKEVWWFQIGHLKRPELLWMSSLKFSTTNTWLTHKYQVNWAHSSVWYRISWRLQWQSCISCWKSIVAKHGNWQLTAGTSHVFMASTSLIVQPFTSFTEYQSLVSKSAINNQRGTGPLAMKKRKVVETNGRTSVMKSFLDGQTASSPQLFIAWIDFQRRIIPWTVIANILPCQFNEANKSHFCSH